MPFTFKELKAQGIRLIPCEISLEHGLKARLAQSELEFHIIKDCDRIASLYPDESVCIYHLYGREHREAVLFATGIKIVDPPFANNRTRRLSWVDDGSGGGSGSGATVNFNHCAVFNKDRLLVRVGDSSGRMISYNPHSYKSPGTMEGEIALSEIIFGNDNEIVEAHQCQPF